MQRLSARSAGDNWGFLVQ